MLTIFCIPKPFLGHIGVIQRNALRSWAHLTPKPEIVVVGDEDGVEEVVREIGAVWVKTVEKTSLGTPLLSDAFHQVAQRATYPVLCYANSDIMFTHDLLTIVQPELVRGSLVAGRRWDADITEPWDFSSMVWGETLQKFTRSQGKQCFHYAMDYFLFERSSPLTRLPAFAVGRPGWDNWFILQARRLRLRVVDASDVVTAVHQNHNHNHVPKRTGPTWQGPEATANLSLLKPDEGNFSLLDATHVLTPGALQRATSPIHLARRREAFKHLHPVAWGVMCRCRRAGSLVKSALRRVNAVIMGRTQGGVSSGAEVADASMDRTRE